MSAGHAGTIVDHNVVLGTAARPMKGIIGWLDEHTLTVVGAGVDARWEKFVIVESADGGPGSTGRSGAGGGTASGGGGGGGGRTLSLVRSGWKRYMGS